MTFPIWQPTSSIDKQPYWALPGTGAKGGDTVPLGVQSAMSRGLQCHREVMQGTGSEMSARAKGALWGCVGWTPSPEPAESKQVSQHLLREELSC